MAVINALIPQQNFELVLERIGEILTNELSNQYTLFPVETAVLEGLLVWKNRYVPFDKSEMPAVNVSLGSGQYSGQTVKSDDGLYQYNIDVFTNAKGTDDKAGDQHSIDKLHRIMGICRAILRNPKFKTLGYETPPGFIMGIPHVDSIQFATPDHEDTARNVMGRLVFSVRMPENTELIEPELLYGYDTIVKLYDTDKGYLWGPFIVGTRIFGRQFDLTFN